MSELVIVRSANEETVRSVLNTWARTQEWVNVIELRDGWEPHELYINRVDAGRWMTGKHKVDFAQLVLLLQGLCAQVVKVTLHGSTVERAEQDQAEWAKRTLERAAKKSKNDVSSP